MSTDSESTTDAPTEGKDAVAAAEQTAADSGNDRAVARVQTPAVTRAALLDLHAWGRLFHASGFFPDVESAAQAAVKILVGREYGISTAAAMTGIHIIDGKPTLSAVLQAAKVKESGKYDYLVTQHTDIFCEIEFFELRGDERVSIGKSAFSLEDAAVAGISERSSRYPERLSMWEKYPRNMLWSRTMTNGIGWYCPDVFGLRVYTPDELRPDLELTEGGDVIDMDDLKVPPGAPVTEAELREPSPSAAQQITSPKPEAPAAPEAPAPRRIANPKSPDEISDAGGFFAWAVDYRSERGLSTDQRSILIAIECETVAEVQQRYKDDWSVLTTRLITAVADELGIEPPSPDTELVDAEGEQVSADDTIAMQASLSADSPATEVDEEEPADGNDGDPPTAEPSA